MSLSSSPCIVVFSFSSAVLPGWSFLLKYLLHHCIINYTSFKLRFWILTCIKQENTTITQVAHVTALHSTCGCMDKHTIFGFFSATVFSSQHSVYSFQSTGMFKQSVFYFFLFYKNMLMFFSTISSFSDV